MILRILGAAALLLGALFGVIALLVLLPFFSNFSTSLLILAAVFGVFAYVFLAIGWQLFRPPARRRGLIEEAADEERWASVSALADGQVDGARSEGVCLRVRRRLDGRRSGRRRRTAVAETVAPEVASRKSWSRNRCPARRGFSLSTPSRSSTHPARRSAVLPPSRGEASLDWVRTSPVPRHDARAGNGHSSERVQFKKPGPPVPERSESRR